jgi:hypothetical protein
MTGRCPHAQIGQFCVERRAALSRMAAAHSGGSACVLPDPSPSLSVTPSIDVAGCRPVGSWGMTGLGLPPDEVSVDAAGERPGRRWLDLV